MPSRKPTLADRKRAARATLTPTTLNPVPAPSAVSAPSTPSSISTPNPADAVTSPSAVDASSAVSAAAPVGADSANTAPSTVGVSSAAGAGGGTISVTLTTQQLRDARAAFLADWEHGGSTATFTAWIEAALRTHAARTPTQRADNMVTASGQTRSFRITDSTRALVAEAVAADCAAGCWVSLSTWAAAAITTATEAARRRGPLPTPPERLPGRLPTRNKDR